MEHATFFWNASDHTRIFGQAWRPDATPNAVILLVHGLGEHSTRYSHVAQMWVDHGSVFVANDHRGHGHSEGKRGHADSYEKFGEEIDHLIDYASEYFPNVPIFLYGHSLGGGIVLYYTLKHHPAVRGTIVTSPGLAPAKISPALKAMAKIFSAITPGLIMKNGLDLQGISHDPQVIEDYTNDPLNHPDISARLGMELISNGEWSIAHANEYPVPLLLLQGSADRLVNVAATQAFADNLKHDLTYQVWPEGFHELHNEPDKEKIFAIMRSWVDTQLA